MENSEFVICIISFSLCRICLFFFFFLQGKSAGDESPQSMCLRKSLLFIFPGSFSGHQIEVSVFSFLILFFKYFTPSVLAYKVSVMRSLL